MNDSSFEKMKPMLDELKKEEPNLIRTVLPKEIAAQFLASPFCQFEDAPEFGPCDGRIEQVRIGKAHDGEDIRIFCCQVHALDAMAHFMEEQ